MTDEQKKECKYNRYSNNTCGGSCSKCTLSYDYVLGLDRGYIRGYNDGYEDGISNDAH